LVILIDLPYTKRASVCLVLNLIIDVYSKSFNNPLQLPVKLPVNDVDIKKFLTGHQYKNSLVSSLPIPAPIKLNRHAYIPISRQLQHASALGLIIEPIHIIDEQHHTVTSSNHPHAITPKGTQLLQDSLLSLGYETSELIPYSPVISATSRRTEYVLIPEQQNRIVSLFKAIFWTDDFDPRTTKNNRGSCWLLCATVGLPDGPHHNRNTFLIALGSSKIDHSEVYETLTKELNDINRNHTSLNLFLKHQNIGVNAHVRPYCFLQDTPETTDCNQTASWKSSHTVLSSYVVDINPLQSKLPSCQSCLTKRMAGVFDTNQRTIGDCCYDWHPPTTVPITKQQLISRCTEAHGIILNDLQDGPRFARDMLRLNGVSPKLVERIVQAGTASMPMPSLPPLWYLDSFDICDSIEVFNHLLFLGIAKTLLKDSLYSWVSCRRQWKEFVALTEQPWAVLIRLKLDWLKLLPISPNGNFGGYVSENFLATSRLLKYILHLTQTLNVQTVTNEYVDPPGATVGNMNNIQMKKWLDARRIKIIMQKVNGRARTVRKNDLSRAISVTGWQAVGDEPLPVLNPLLNRGHSSLANLIVSFHSMVCSVLNLDPLPSNYQLQLVDHWVKLYLSHDNQFTGSSVDDQAGHIFEARLNVTDGVDVLFDVRDGSVVRVVRSISNLPDAEILMAHNNTPIIAARGNSAILGRGRYLPSLQKRNKINLVKLPFTLQRYGSYRVHLSELGSAGEGNVMTVRPLIKRVQGMKKNWEYNVARDWSTINYCKRLTKSLADSNLLGDEGLASGLFVQFQRLYETNVFDKTSNEVKKMFHVYNSRDVVVETVNANKPLSFVCLDSQTYVACYLRSRCVEEYTGVCLDVTYHLSCRQSKAYYWNISIETNNMSTTFKATNILQFCVGLPICPCDTDGLPWSYYIITSNWEELVMEGNNCPTFQSPANKTSLDTDW
jgi:hypothetical protein